jgi:hypothetical protein
MLYTKKNDINEGKCVFHHEIFQLFIKTFSPMLPCQKSISNFQVFLLLFVVIISRRSNYFIV